ncbi:hypothetical protein ACW9YS_05555 [Paraburkholderia strydomiana]
MGRGRQAAHELEAFPFARVITLLREHITNYTYEPSHIPLDANDLALMRIGQHTANPSRYWRAGQPRSPGEFVIAIGDGAFPKDHEQARSPRA